MNNAQFLRILTAAHCHTTAELAIFLGIKEATVNKAKRKGHIPKRWLIILQQAGINPGWVNTGEGAMHLLPEPGKHFANTTRYCLASCPAIAIAEQLLTALQNCSCLCTSTDNSR